MSENAGDELDAAGWDALAQVVHATIARYQASWHLRSASRKMALAETAYTVSATRARELGVPEHLIEKSIADAEAIA